MALEITDANFSIYSNVSAKPVRESEEIRESLIQQLENAASNVITVTTTSTDLISLMDAAGSTTYNLDSQVNGVDLKVESGSVRISQGNTPTSTAGYLMSEGDVHHLRNVTLKNLNLIVAEGSTASISLG